MSALLLWGAPHPVVAAGAGGATGSAPVLTVLARSGQAAPGTSTTFTGFGDPAINGAGLVGFQGLLAPVGGGDASIGLFAAAQGSLVPVILQGQPAPGTSGVFAHPPGDFNGSGAFPFIPRLDDAGDVAYGGDYTAGGGYYADSAGVFLDGAASAVEGTPTPDGAQFHFDFDYAVPPVVSPNGTIALLTQVCPCVYPAEPSSGIYLRSGGRWTAVVRQGQTAPGGGVFQPQSAEDPMGFSPPAVNDAGQVAFAARLDGSSDGLYLYSGGALRTLAATGAALPDGRKVASLYSVQHGPALNAGGTVAALIGTSDYGQGVYAFGPGGARLVLHTGDRDPAGSGELVCALGDPGLGDDGTLAFTATLVPPGVPGCGTQRVLYVGQPGALHEAGAVQMPAQEALGQTTDIGPDQPYVSPEGWVGFIAQRAGTSTLYVWNGSAAVRVAGVGDTIGGWQVSNLDFAGVAAAGATALNAAGQIVFRAFGGTQGSEIVLASLSGGRAATFPAWLASAATGPAGASAPPGRGPGGTGQPGNNQAGTQPAGGGTQGGGANPSSTAGQGGASGPAGSGAGADGQSGGGQPAAGVAGPPTLTAVSPAAGSDWGGDTVTLTGSGFTVAATVQFGPYNYATVAQVSAAGASMTVTTPPDLDGPVEVTVSVAGASATLPNAFTFRPPPGA